MPGPPSMERVPLMYRLSASHRKSWPRRSRREPRVAPPAFCSVHVERLLVRLPQLDGLDLAREAEIGNERKAAVP